MKKIFLSILTVFLGLFAMSQGKLTKTSDPQVAQMEASRKGNAPYSVRFTEDANIKIGDAQSVLNKYLNLRTGIDELRLRQSDGGKDNIVVNRYQQYFKNIKVEHGSYVATAKGGRISFINGDFYSIKETTGTTAQLSETDALSKALGEINAQLYKWQMPGEEAFLKREAKDPTATYYPKGELVFVEDYNTGVELNGKVKLAYKFDIYAEAPLSRDYVYVDATTGKILLIDAIIKHAHDKNAKGTPAAAAINKADGPNVFGTAASRYSGTVSLPTTLSGPNYILQSSLAVDNYPLHTLNCHKTTSYAGATEFTDADNSWTAGEFNNANFDNVAFDAHWGAMQVINYWRTRHGRNSYDNNNATINSYVHYSNAYDNAFWNGSVMTYGDGTNITNGFSPLASLDVCGHEIGHAICTFTSNLVYQRESGAMNEGFSDIWGASIEHFADPHEGDAVAKSYFLIGEEISQLLAPPFLRSMSDPKAATQPHQPDTYGGQYWRDPSVAACPVPNSNTNDNCWVHYNSGVLNHWFYIMVQGKIGTNDVGYSYNVTGIGWIDAEKITYLGEQNLAPSADYKACRTAMYNAAITLFGPCSVQAATVLKAFDAVNVLGITPQPVLTLTQSVTQQNEGLNVTYTNHVVSLCPTQPFTNYIVRDTLPANVTFVSATNGGTYAPATRVVSWPVTLAGGGSQDYAFTVSINAGSYFTPVNLFDDPVTGVTIPATWTAASSTATNWVVSQARVHSAPNSYFSANIPIISDQTLTSATAIALGATPPNLSFWHWYSTESTYDGGVLEISTDGGANYVYVPAANILSGGYSGTMDPSTVLAGKQAWTGASGDFIKTTVNLTPYANQSVKLRFRFSSDNGTNAEGWYVDDIAIKNVPTVEIRSSLFDASNVRVQWLDISTVILPPVGGCSTVAITSQPAASTICTGNNTTFSVTATGLAPVYKWQVSPTGCAGTFTDISNTGVYSGATTNTLTITNAPVTMTGYAYRVVVSNSCPSTANSNCVLLTVNSPATVTSHPSNLTICEGAGTTFSVVATSNSGPTLSYQWQFSSNGGGSYSDIAGATNATFTQTNVPVGQNGYMFRVRLIAACGFMYSNAATLTVNTYPVITFTPTAIVCASDPSFSLSATPAGGAFTGTGVSGSTFSPSVAGVGAKTVTYTVSNAGCQSTAARVVLVNDCAERHLTLEQFQSVFVYPNPNNGAFSIRMNTDLYTRLNIKIYDALGRLVLTQSATGLTYGTVIPLQLPNTIAPVKGVYHLFLSNDERATISKRGTSIIVSK